MYVLFIFNKTFQFDIEIVFKNRNTHQKYKNEMKSCLNWACMIYELQITNINLSTCWKYSIFYDILRCCVKVYVNHYMYK